MFWPILRKPKTKRDHAGPLHRKGDKKEQKGEALNRDICFLNHFIYYIVHVQGLTLLVWSPTTPWYSCLTSSKHLQLLVFLFQLQIGYKLRNRRCVHIGKLLRFKLEHPATVHSSFTEKLFSADCIENAPDAMKKSLVFFHCASQHRRRIHC